MLKSQSSKLQLRNGFALSPTSPSHTNVHLLNWHSLNLDDGATEMVVASKVSPTICVTTLGKSRALTSIANDFTPNKPLNGVGHFIAISLPYITRRGVRPMPDMTSIVRPCRQRLQHSFDSLQAERRQHLTDEWFADLGRRRSWHFVIHR